MVTFLTLSDLRVLDVLSCWLFAGHQSIYQKGCLPNNSCLCREKMVCNFNVLRLNERKLLNEPMRFICK